MPDWNADFSSKNIHTWDMISIGPQMYGVHSPDERLSISSTQNCWKWFGGDIG